MPDPHLRELTMGVRLRRLARSPWIPRASLAIGIGFILYSLLDPGLAAWSRVVDVVMIVVLVWALVTTERSRRRWKQQREEMIAASPNPDRFRASLAYFLDTPWREHRQLLDWEMSRDFAVPLEEALLDAPPVVRDYYAAMAPYDSPR